MLPLTGSTERQFTIVLLIMITTTPQRILFFTNGEYGQANVVLSVAHELALRPNAAVHIASFSGNAGVMFIWIF